jgi:tetratricopeptide (TPR) repeat protein
MGLARLYGLQGQWDEALGVLRRLQETLGSDPMVLAEFAAAEEHIGNAHAATRLYGEAVFLAPDRAPLRELLAAALIRQDRIEEAIWELAEAVALDPDSPAVELLPELAAADPARLQPIVDSLWDRARLAPPSDALCTAILQACERAGDSRLAHHTLAALASSWPKSPAARQLADLQEEAGEADEDAIVGRAAPSTDH